MNQQLDFTDAEWSSLAAEFCKGFTDEQIGVCRTFCRIRNLIPGKHVVFQLRRAKEWDDYVKAKVDVTKIVFITTIDAARLIALRSGEYTGQDPETYIYLSTDGSEFIESKIPLPRLPIVPGQTPLPREPWAVRTTVFRKGFDHPITSVARFDAYASTYKGSEGVQLTDMWLKRGPEQLAKCSEMLSLRKSFPEELSSLYLDLELKNEAQEEKPTPVTPASILPEPPVVPQVNQVPAVPTETPRPNEMPKETAKTVLAAMPKIEEFVNNPEVQKQLATEGKKVDHEELARVKAAALAAAPDLKPASELPEPKKKGGRPKKQDSLGNGQPPVEGITDSDLSAIGTPASVTNTAENKAEAEKFVAGLDPTPTKEEMKSFTDRVRTLTSQGVKSDEIKARVLEVGGTDDTKKVTVRAWKQVLEEFEAKPKPF